MQTAMRAARLSEKLTRFAGSSLARGSPSRPRPASPPRPRRAHVCDACPAHDLVCDACPAHRACPPRARGPCSSISVFSAGPPCAFAVGCPGAECCLREAEAGGDRPAERTQAAPGAALTVHPRPGRSEGLRRPSPPGPEEGALALRPRRPARHPQLLFPVPTSPRPARPRPRSSPASPTPHSALPFQWSSRNLLGAPVAQRRPPDPGVRVDLLVAIPWPSASGRRASGGPSLRDVAQTSRALQLRPGVRGLGGGRPPPPAM